jgi:hypothetical protein
MQLTLPPFNKGSPLCPCAITLILFFAFLYQLGGPCLYIFAIYFVPGEFASQEILRTNFGI